MPCLIPRIVARFLLSSVAICVSSAAVFGQQVTVDITAGHAVNIISPVRALGAGVDRDPLSSVSTLFDSAHVGQMLSAGYGPVSYRLNTELAIQAWHWNPTGTWSDAANQQGYFVGAPNYSDGIQRSFGYNLLHRGVTKNQGSSGGYSLLDDGDVSTYWKSDPYLSERFTGESDALHGQWIVINLGAKKSVDTIQIAWADPYAISYQVQYWTGKNAFDDPANGTWQTFPNGTVQTSRGGTVTLKLANKPISAKYVRVWMTASSETCDTHGTSDVRNCVGYAIGEVYLGTTDGKGNLVDLVNHRKAGSQTLTYCSSVDPWHTPSGIADDDGEQPGFDLLYASGITRGLPVTIPVAMLYDNPDNAANEIGYLETQGYSIKYVELGEEPDGQFVLPEDDAALYIQWANAIHAVDPKLKLAGPVFQGVNDDIPVWPDAQGNTSWFTRFLNYLKNHGHAADLNVMTYEHYPFDPCSISWNSLYQEPQIVAHMFGVWQQDGLSASTSQEITEYNLSWDQSVRYMQSYAALWHADFVGSFLTAGGQAAYYYQYEPLPMYKGCGGWGTFGMFDVDNNYNIKQNVAQYFSSQLLTQQWAQPVDAMHTVYPAASDVTDRKGDVLVTAYALERPDGQWGLLLVNKDQHSDHPVSVVFHDQAGSHYFQNGLAQISFGADEYLWHAAGANGYAMPDGPAVTSTQNGGQGTQYILPKASVTVLRGNVQ
jgi:hypothetical protein